MKKDPLAILPFWLISIPLLGFIALLAFSLVKPTAQPSSPLMGKTAPSFELREFRTQEKISSQSLLGKPYMMNFWASWCKPCRQEALVLSQAYEVYGLRVKMIGVAVQDTPKAARDFANEFNKKYFLAMDGAKGYMALKYGLFGIPETFFINSKGIVVGKHTGPLDRKILDKYFQVLFTIAPPELPLAAPSPSPSLALALAHPPSPSIPHLLFRQIGALK